jgi:hypothetical protein
MPVPSPIIAENAASKILIRIAKSPRHEIRRFAQIEI